MAKWRTARYSAVVAALVGAMTFGTAGTAQAVDPCNDICFYWDSGLGGSVRSYGASEVRADFGSDTFTRPGPGYGQRVKNNSASVYNDTPRTAEVCYNENYGGPCDLIPPFSWRNLFHTWNDNASFRWV
jgi:Peptidase inhibitor family I36